MTSRLLLTLLALLTGFAIEASPAQARAQTSRASEMSAVAALAGEVREASPAGIAPCPAVAGKARLAGKWQAPLLAAVVLAPAVRTGIDRARE